MIAVDRSKDIALEEEQDIVKLLNNVNTTLEFVNKWNEHQ